MAAYLLRWKIGSVAMCDFVSTHAYKYFINAKSILLFTSSAIVSLVTSQMAVLIGTFGMEWSRTWSANAMHPGLKFLRHQQFSSKVDHSMNFANMRQYLLILILKQFYTYTLDRDKMVKYFI